MSKHGAHSSGTNPDPEGDAAPTRFDRRRFLVWTAAGGVVAAGTAIGIAESSGSDEHASANGDRAKRPTSAKSRKLTSTLPDGVVVPTSAAILAENAKIGQAWWVTTPQNAGDIEGYVNQASAVIGDTVTLYVNTKAASFHVEAYRMGYYQGIGARLVWQSAEVPGLRQALPALHAPTNTIECDWSPSVTMTVDATWPPGAYLLKLVGATNEQGFVPLCVRDDTSQAAIVIQQSVTTWQAYNR